ncbi:MAG: hypothetical protein ACE14V_10915 [bacterium]
MLKQYKIIFIAAVIILGVFGTASADWYYGDFQTGIDGWFKDWENNATLSGVQQVAAAGTNGCLQWVVTCTSTTGNADITCAPFGNYGWNFAGETTMVVKLALTGTVASTQVAFYSKSGGSWNSAPFVYHWQLCDGNFVTYTFPIDSTFVVYPDQVSFPIIVGVFLNSAGVVTTQLDYAKSLGSLVPLETGVYAEFKNWFDLSPWSVTGNGQAIKDHTTVATSGLHLDNSGVGTLWYVSLASTASGVNSGGQIRDSISADTYRAGTFVEWRIAIETTAGPVAYSASGALISYDYGIGYWFAVPQTFIVDGQYHTYDWSTTGDYNIRQLYLELYGHGETELKVTIDWIKVKTTGTPKIYTGGTEVALYNDPANVISKDPGQSQTFYVFRGLAPFTWSMVTVYGTPGTLNTVSGGTVVFTASSGGGGVGYIMVTDADGRTHRTPNIEVNPTSAPLAIEPQTAIIHRALFE